MDNASHDGASAAAGGIFDEGNLFISKKDQESQNGLERIDNITDHALGMFRVDYNDPKITKDDIFDYVYGVLHAPDVRKAYPIALSHNPPRVPMAEDFWVFAKAEKDLTDLHLNYETDPEYNLQLHFSSDGEPTEDHFRISDKPMRFAGKKGSLHRSTLHMTSSISLSGIPHEAHEYVVNGRSPLEWFIDRYKITVDKKSGIRNDPNEWFGDPRAIISTIKRIVYLSVETTHNVAGLPPSLAQIQDT
ncbi:MAG: hypothetical protein OXC68_00155 [Aestuariivita sp.]|nr:hypothetical protein [Aestuariivita sp.]